MKNNEEIKNENLEVKETEKPIEVDTLGNEKEVEVKQDINNDLINELKNMVKKQDEMNSKLLNEMKSMKVKYNEILEKTNSVKKEEYIEYNGKKIKKDW